MLISLHLYSTPNLQPMIHIPSLNSPPWNLNKHLLPIDKTFREVETSLRALLRMILSFVNLLNYVLCKIYKPNNYVTVYSITYILSYVGTGYKIKFILVNCTFSNNACFHYY